MSDDEAVTVTADDITVRKTVDTEEFQTVAVVLELTSDRDESARVQVIDAVPDGVSMDDIGFHLDYGAEHWSVEDGTVVFERDLEPDEAYTTIYGIREYPEDELEALRGEPEVGLIDVDPGDLESVVDEGRSDVIRDFLSGDTELAGLEETIGGADDGPAASEAATQDAGPADADEPAATADHEAPGGAVDEPATESTGAEGAETGAPAGGDEGSGDDGGSVPLSGGVVRVLIKELRHGDVDPEHRRILREELVDTDDSIEARVAHLQQRMSDIEAYTDALEEFLREEGTGQAVIADLQSDLRELEAAVESGPDGLDDALDRLETVDDRLESVARDAEAALDRSTGFDDRLGDVESEVAGIDERVTELRSELESRAQELRADLEALETDLDELEEFHDRLKSVFGAEGGPAEPPE